MHPLAKPRIPCALLLAPLLALMCASMPVTAAPPEVKSFDDGWYTQRFKTVGIAYLVDSIGRSCYAVTATGMSEINCRSLKRREEWEAIITWERKAKSN